MRLLVLEVRSATRNLRARSSGDAAWLGLALSIGPAPWSHPQLPVRVLPHWTTEVSGAQRAWDWGWTGRQGRAAGTWSAHGALQHPSLESLDAPTHQNKTDSRSSWSRTSRFSPARSIVSPNLLKAALRRLRAARPPLPLHNVSTEAARAELSAILASPSVSRRTTGSTVSPLPPGAMPFVSDAR